MREFCHAGGSLPLGNNVYLMGILNVTPDSFSDGGSFFAPEKALARGLALAAEGADVLDVGCCSTRPGGAYASEEEELSRLKSVLPALRRETRVPISVDTFRPAVARYALDAGADLINDVSGVFSAEMAAAVRAYGAGWVLTHAGNGAATAEVLEYPRGVTVHVQAFFDDMLQRCAAAGLRREQLCLDPGFGFAKTVSQNLRLLRELDRLRTGGAALLAGLSRKRFVGAVSGEADPAGRLYGTLAADLAAAERGADFLRVHDVAAHAAALRMAAALRPTDGGGETE